MKTKQEVEARIREVKAHYAHVLRGSLATVEINAPRALMQVAAESKLEALHWVLGREFKMKLKGIDR